MICVDAGVKLSFRSEELYNRCVATVEKSKIFAIGDVHGCAEELAELLAKLPITPDSWVVFLGDYVDRGPASRQVVEAILALQRRCHVVACKGNHESMLLDFLEHPESNGAAMFILNGGSSTLASYADDKGSWKIPLEHLNFFYNLKPYFETERHFFVHAGVPDIPLKDLQLARHEDVMLWIRSPFLKSRYKWEKLVVHGHSPVDQPENLINRINVDTGCVYDGGLTAVQLPERIFFTVAKKVTGEEPRYLADSFGSARVAKRFTGAVMVLIENKDKLIEFETLNYNQFGLLIGSRAGATGSLSVGQKVKGHIGPPSTSAVPPTVREGSLSFAGEVVRSETRNGQTVFGLKIELEKVRS